MRPALGILALLCLPAYASEGAALKERLARMELRLPSFDGMKLEDELSVEASGLRTDEVLAVSASGDRKARVVVTTGTNSAALEALLLSKRETLKAAYSIKNPGDGTLKVKTCKPSETGSSTRTGYTLLADERLAFGICDKAKAKFHAAVFFLVCKGRVVEIYYYFPTRISPKPELRKLMATECGKEGEGFGA